MVPKAVHAAGNERIPAQAVHRSLHGCGVPKDVLTLGPFRYSSHVGHRSIPLKRQPSSALCLSAPFAARRPPRGFGATQSRPTPPPTRAPPSPFILRPSPFLP